MIPRTMVLIMMIALTPLSFVGGFEPTDDNNHHLETKEQKDERMEWWSDARFGMFIHWGLYANPAGVWKGKVSWSCAAGAIITKATT